MHRNRRILLTTGGTGGHVFPALSVAEELQRQDSSVKLLFVGSNYGPEKNYVSRAGLEFAGLEVRGIKGRGLKAIGAAFSLAKAFCTALALVRGFRPDVVAGFGGYAAFAPMAAAISLGIPAILHEQNAIAGSANRLLGRFAKKICLSLPDTVGFPASKCVVSGNPVRADIRRLGQSRGGQSVRQSGKRLLILGGSQGAHAINAYLAAILPQLHASGVELRHQTGTADYQSIARAYREAGYPDDCVSPFIERMDEAYAWADLVLARSGASTVAELCACGLPAILVPFPHAIHDHQRLNAVSLERAGAASVIDESKLAEPDTLMTILALLADQDRRQRMSNAAFGLACPKAAETIVSVIRCLLPGE